MGTYLHSSFRAGPLLIHTGVGSSLTTDMQARLLTTKDKMDRMVRRRQEIEAIIHLLRKVRRRRRWKTWSTMNIRYTGSN